MWVHFIETHSHAGWSVPPIYGLSGCVSHLKFCLCEPLPPKSRCEPKKVSSCEKPNGCQWDTAVKLKALQTRRRRARDVAREWESVMHTITKYRFPCKVFWSALHLQNTCRCTLGCWICHEYKPKAAAAAAPSQALSRTMNWIHCVHIRINLKLADAKTFGNSWDYYKIKLRIMFLWIGMQNQSPYGR